MAKIKKAFFCKECGNESAKWMGKCPSCQAWNSFVEEVIDGGGPKGRKTWQEESGSKGVKSKPVPLSEVQELETSRLSTTDHEFDRVLGGGIVPGSIVLIGGEPGIGKSTLLLQTILRLANHKVLYVSGEESARQIKLRAERIGEVHDNCIIYTETLTRDIFKQAEEIQPELLVIDSIQTVYTDQIDATPGSVSQIRECTGELQRFSKEKGVPVILVGHITKDGAIAGPKILEHMVDTVLQFEGDRNHNYRILRTIKNRFGAAAEIGLYEMRETGLREVLNPSEILIGERQEGLSGIAIGAVLEGQRAMLMEIQALVSPAVYGTPQRSSTGYDPRRANMILAVLEKRAGFRLGLQDVFVNITGGIRVEDPGVDLAIATAMISSMEDVPVPTGLVFAGEIGLSGEVRPVMKIEQRIREAAKLGFKEIYISAHHKKGIQTDGLEISVRFVSGIAQLYKELFT